MLEPIPAEIRDKYPSIASYLDKLLRDINKPIAAEEITDAMIRPGAVGTAALADGSVTTPKIADANVTVAKLGTDWPSVVVTNAAPANLVNNTLTTITWPTEVYDVGACHNPGVNPTRLTAPIAGVYLAWFAWAFAANAVGDRIWYITSNGATFEAIRTQKAIGTAALGTYDIISKPIKLAAAGYIEAQAYQNSGGALGAIVGANYSPYFGMEYMHP